MCYYSSYYDGLGYGCGGLGRSYGCGYGGYGGYGLYGDHGGYGGCGLYGGCGCRCCRPLCCGRYWSYGFY
ncbi:keratin-associated protein 20-2-like [Nannospalax galili]|uniref:keratin-associated protein 20-2-like n=1 Tax=Nannospalax galili TaxID=1026970 RepID=UPI00111C4F25|nr:keratin-associated protein 20-2-like [Nannospalax galili]